LPTSGPKRAAPEKEIDVVTFAKDVLRAANAARALLRRPANLGSRMTRRDALIGAAIVVALGTAGIGAVGQRPAGEFQDEFGIEKCALSTTGRNDFFVLEPGFRLVLEGGNTRLEVTVLNETHKVAGVETRVVEERSLNGGDLHEVARNYFAICPQTNDVFYFGEDVEFYLDGKLTGREGTWHAGVKGARAGLIMPGQPKVGMKYYHELAPGQAMDRAEVVSLDEEIKTPAGRFAKVLKTREGTALKPHEMEYKYYAPGIGLIKDNEVALVKYGFVDGK
jgi:hypothetical protein